MYEFLAPLGTLSTADCFCLLGRTLGDSKLFSSLTITMGDRDRRRKAAELILINSGIDSLLRVPDLASYINLLVLNLHHNNITKYECIK